MVNGGLILENSFREETVGRLRVADLRSERASVRRSNSAGRVTLKGKDAGSLSKCSSF
jgi:hypothetical protein